MIFIKKRFVVDSSVLLYDIDSLYKFENNEVIIPSIVLEEVNKFKDEVSERGFHATEVSKVLEELSEKGRLKDGVYLNETLIRTSYDLENKNITKSLKFDENDYHIIACAKNHNATLITRDRMMRVIARDFIEAENYQADQLKVKEMYKGYRKKKVSEDIITKLYSNQLNNEFNLYPNEFIILENEINKAHTGIGICKKDKIIPCHFDNMNKLGLKLKKKPLNLEQKMLLYLLLDKDILAVSISGVSGKGKTLLSVDVALSMVFGKHQNQFVFTKSVKPIDKSEELGFYQGGPDEKLEPHIRPLISSIENIYKKELYGGNERKSALEKLYELKEQDVLETIPLANIRGMSVSDKVVMLDEGQNTTNHTMKSLVTRLEDSSKLIVSGDIDQIDDRHLNQFNNGLIHLVEAGKEENFIAHITLDLEKKSQRGKLASFGTIKL